MTESPSHIKKKPVLRWVYGALCVIMMALIFWFSAMEAPQRYPGRSRRPPSGWYIRTIPSSTASSRPALSD